MNEKAASRGQPSFAWRFGQVRRLSMIAAHLPERPRAALDIGCGVGAYTRELAQLTGLAIGLEVDWDRARQAHAQGLQVAAAIAEQLPFADGSFDVVLLHEVLEHVRDDTASAREAVRILAPGGRAVIFVPNRLWPFETHGIHWAGRYRCGNIPLVNYLPDPVRDRLAPHVRAYTARGVRALFDGEPVRVVCQRGVFPGYDNLAARRPRLGRWLRTVTYALEATPLARLGLSHLLVVERLPPPTAGTSQVD